MRAIGEERTEKLKTIPAQSSVLVEIKKKYVCPCCESHAQAKSNSILPGTIATPELLSYIVFSKFFQALPLYRLEELFKLQKIHLTRGTMARWLIKVIEQLIPIYNILQDKAFESGCMAIDATHVQVLKEAGRKAETDSSMWARGSPGRYEIDNGWLERTIKKFAIGRNNWIFCDTVEGAHASAMLYSSFAITAKLNGKNPFEVMTEIFSKLPEAKTADDYEKLANMLLSPANPLSCRKKEG